MFGLNPFTSKTYCGHCKCDFCQCDGYGNFGSVENVSWLPRDVEENRTIDEGAQKGRLTNEDGTPYKPTREYHEPSEQLQADRAARGPQERPQRR